MEKYYHLERKKFDPFYIAYTKGNFRQIKNVDIKLSLQKYYRKL